MKKQEFTSADTSINANNVPTLFSTLINKADKLNIKLHMQCVYDTGCGKYPEIIEKALNAHYCAYIGRDKFNQSEEVNNSWIDCVTMDDFGYERLFTSSNVLNVIKEKEIRKQYIDDIKQYMKTGEKLYITVYEGNKSGIGCITKKDCYQLNKKLADYIPELKNSFSSVVKKYGMLICTL